LKKETTRRTIEALETTANRITPTNKIDLSNVSRGSPDSKRKISATTKVNVHMNKPINNALEI
ncbi:hypothetical protein J4G37_58700, partial [Microvirga sp. 3-52]|nr:hypothetical protein [Microvirga sp. 3-52]